MLATFVLLAGMVIAAPAANAAVLTQSLGPDLTPAQLAGALVGTGVTVSNAAVHGREHRRRDVLRRRDGSGRDHRVRPGSRSSARAPIANVPGPNNADNATTNNGQPGDASLNALLPVGQTTKDAAVLTFDFVPDASSVSFKYVFSSEEYNEFVGRGLQRRLRVLRERHELRHRGRRSPCRVDTINGGNPFGTNPSNASELFRNNDPNDPGPPTIDTQMDGLTTVLTCTAPVTANQTNTMKLAIGDVGDSAFDSDVFIEAGSLTTEPPTDVPDAPTDVTAAPGDGSAHGELDGPALRRRQRDRRLHRHVHGDREPGRLAHGVDGRRDLGAGHRAHERRRVHVHGHRAQRQRRLGAVRGLRAVHADRRPTSRSSPRRSTRRRAASCVINPEGPANFQGTTAKIKIPPQGGPGQ